MSDSLVTYLTYIIVFFNGFFLAQNVSSFKINNV
nr:MAG TPA: hypothetical protein [Caudoviricetes sp.]